MAGYNKLEKEKIMRRKLLILLIGGILSGCVTIENIDKTPFFIIKI